MEFKDYSFYRQHYVEETGTTYFICPPPIKDARSEMRTALQKACLSNLSMPPGMVWERVMASLREAYPEETLSTIP
ncbi:hypothetical protein PI125_g24458 [Phytophthora idaei]|nr:hypothetical protein PI125_g24458 [Phytophthora idaei]KAG3126044.1 hypothetical protein PI126_g22502 [Phytophthora idaei]